MGFVGYLFFALKCFDLYAGPLFSLGYPLCASICAIESNSNSDTRKLIAYWVFYSLISLFEHAFMKLLEWLPFWPRMKLMIMFWLMIPHFSGALYFYELLVQPCLSLVPQIVINLFNEWKEPCLKRDDFPTEAAERYQKQNESEASEELISSDESKSIENNAGQKEDKDVEVTEENVEVTKENEDVEVTEENEDVEVKEKNEVAAIERVTPIESTIVQTGKSIETLTDMNVSSKSTPDFTEVQRKISLLQHQRNMNIHRQKKCESSNGLKEEVNIKQWDVHGLQINSEKIVQDTRSPLLCYICNVWCPNKVNLDAHRKGKKHLAQIQELANFVEVKEENEDVEVTKENEDVEVIEENEVAAIERVTPIESTLVQTGKSTETLTVEVTEENEDVEVTKENEVAAIERVTPIESTLVQIGKSTETLIVEEENEDVEVTEENEVATIERVTPIESTIVQTGKSTETLTVEVTEENEDVEVIEENEDVEVTEKNEVAAIERVTPIESTLVQTGKSTEALTDMNVTSKSTPNFTEVQKKWACAICMVTIQSETTLNSHLQGRRHKANCEVLKAITRAKKKNFPTSTTMKHEHTQTQKKCASSNGLKEEVNIKQWDVHGLQINSKKIVQDARSPLLCYICNVRCPNKDNLDAHLKGKKHFTQIQELANFVKGQHA